MDPLPSNAPETPAGQQPAEPNPVERRINALYGQMKQEQERAAAAETTAAELRAQLAELHEEVTLLKAHRQTQPTTPTSQYQPPPVVSSSSGSSPDELVERAVKRVVGPFVEEFQQREKASVLRETQRQFLSKAAEEFPELNQPGSELRRRADQIWMQDPALKQLPHGPYLAVLAARGALGETRPPTLEQKLAAAQIGAGAGIGGVQNPKAPEIAKMDARIAELKQQLRDGQDADGRRVDPARAWNESRMLQIRRAKMAGTPNIGDLPPDVAAAWGIQ